MLHGLQAATIYRSDRGDDGPAHSVAATTAPAPAAPAAPNTVDLKRAVATGGKLRLEFLPSHLSALSTGEWGDPG